MESLNKPLLFGDTLIWDEPYISESPQPDETTLMYIESKKSMWNVNKNLPILEFSLTPHLQAKRR
jgi:hypothetical protein